MKNLNSKNPIRNICENTLSHFCTAADPTDFPSFSTTATTMKNNRCPNGKWTKATLSTLYVSY